MKVLVVSKTITNSGDFLYAEYTKKFLEFHFSEIEFVYDDAFHEYVEEELLEYNAIIVSGGPLYDNRLMTYKYYPFMKFAFDNNIPVAFLGCGVYGKTGIDEDVYSYQFSAETLEIMNRISYNGFLGCRDYISEQILRNNGLSNTVITGCPTWYDMEWIDKPCRKVKKPQKIMISDPGVTKKKSDQRSKAKQACDLVEWMKKQYPYAEIVFSFNNGILTKYSAECNLLVKQFLDENQIKWINMERDSSKFHEYDNADLHVGFRVHSHLYCMAHRIPTILIEEDRRGYGMSDILGLRHIFAYDIKREGEDKFYPNPVLLQRIRDEISQLYKSDMLDLSMAYERMKFYKDVFKEALEHFFYNE